MSAEREWDGWVWRPLAGDECMTGSDTYPPDWKGEPGPGWRRVRPAVSPLAQHIAKTLFGSGGPLAKRDGGGQDMTALDYGLPCCGHRLVQHADGFTSHGDTSRCGCCRGGERLAQALALMAEPDRNFAPEDIPIADGYSRDDFGTPDEVRGWNLCRDYVISMMMTDPDFVTPPRAPVTHYLNAYTWAGRRAACAVTAEFLDCNRTWEGVTCPRCLATRAPSQTSTGVDDLPADRATTTSAQKGTPDLAASAPDRAADAAGTTHTSAGGDQ